MKNRNHSIPTTNESFACQLHCNPVIIPIEFKQKAVALTSLFVRNYSIPNQVEINYSIVYNRVCNRINELLEATPNFTPQTFGNYLSIGNLFYSQSDIDTLVAIYNTRTAPYLFDYVQCFFAVSLKRIRTTYYTYLRFIPKDDIISAQQIGVFEALESYDISKGHFSFENFNLIVRSKIFELLGNSSFWGFNRNEFSEYYRLCALFKDYNPELSQLENFIEEFTEEYRLSGITASKAKNFFFLYLAESLGISQLTVYDEATDSMLDMTPGTIEQGYIGAELRLYIDQVCQTPKEKYILEHIIDNGSLTFSAEDLAFGHITRYQVKKLVDRVKKDFI